jgi:DNA topoisomerase II
LRVSVLVKGLIINFIHNFWPSLLDIPGFLQQFITPIVKVTKNKRTRTFFTIPEYQKWLESTGNNGKGFAIKYFKGLGTSTSAEAKEYFSDLGTHLIDFGCIKEDQIAAEDTEQVLPDSVASGSDMIDMVFRKDRVEDRKTWLSNIKTGVYLDYKEASTEGVRYSDFFNKEFILFSQYDTHRSIPHLVDGLKVIIVYGEPCVRHYISHLFQPSQRKVLFGCFKRKLTKNEIKVAQLVGYIAEHSAYHHGEMSLQSTIVNMAQNFVVSLVLTFSSACIANSLCLKGSNNVNLLTPSGQFGTRRMGGKDAASARYIFTKLEPIARAIFHPDDDALLNYLNDDGSSIEPEYYVPVIPMILVNGADGIGTGWSSAICNVR